MSNRDEFFRRLGLFLQNERNNHGMYTYYSWEASEDGVDVKLQVWGNFYNMEGEDE